ncbi:hypothetical protein CN327_17670 [Bacillus cereus]|nr:hypothetical protein CN327_17670 [Bacillus cereus]
MRHWKATVRWSDEVGTTKEDIIFCTYEKGLNKKAVTADLKPKVNVALMRKSIGCSLQSLTLVEVKN